MRADVVQACPSFAGGLAGVRPAGLRAAAAALGAALLVALLLALAAVPAGLASERADDPVDAAVRADILKRPDGQIAQMRTEYNDISISKRRDELTMSFRVKGSEYTETVVNLRDPDELPVHYTRSMTTALAYPAEPKRVLMVGLGGGSISTYLARAMPSLKIDTVEIDPGVIDAAKQYFGLRETPRVRFFANDGRVFIRRSTEKYDIILLDAFQGSSVPFHLLTREFYALLKEKLTPTGVAAFNVHEGTKLYLSTIKTLGAVFADVHLYPSGEGEVIVVGSAQQAPDAETLVKNAAALQERHRFRYPLPELLKKRVAPPPLDRGVLLTDDFGSVDLYNANKREPKKTP